MQQGVICFLGQRTSGLVDLESQLALRTVW